MPTESSKAIYWGNAQLSIYICWLVAFAAARVLVIKSELSKNVIYGGGSSTGPLCAKLEC